MKPASSFRSHYAYDNLMYIAAGQIIPAVTGKSWEEYIREKILQPLGMKTTNLSTTAFKPGDNYAWPHSKVEGKLQTIPFQDLDNAGPAGAINSSVAEMAKWIMLQLNHGKFPGREERLFSEAQSHEMWTAQTLTPISTPDSPLAALRPKFSAYALGWGVRDYHGRKLVGHSGGVSGFVTRVLLVPEENLGMVILTNAEDGGAFESIVYHVLDSNFGLPPTEWTTAFKAAEEEEQKTAKQAMMESDRGRAANSKPSLPLEKYAGVYNDAWYGPVTIKQESSGLVLSLDHTPKAVADLQPWQFDTFKAHWRDRTIEDAFVTFTLKPDGTIDHFTMAAVSPLADFSFDYQDLWFTREQPRAH
jgi:CubicO group peptidase (beta-lactamase class C family)